MSTTDTTSTVDALAVVMTQITNLESERAERKDPLDLPHVWTVRQVKAYEAETAELDRQIGKLRTAADAVDHAERGVLAADHHHTQITRWSDFLIATRADLYNRLLTFSQSPRTRREREQVLQLEGAIDAIDKGPQEPPIVGGIAPPPPLVQAAMTAAGHTQEDPNGIWARFGGWPWRGSRVETEKALADTVKRQQRAHWEQSAARRTIEKLAAQITQTAQPIT